MRSQSIATAARVVGLGMCVLIIGAGCGEDHVTFAPLAPTAMATPTPAATATPRENENLFGSTRMGGGALTIDALPSVEIFFSTCLGGSGDDCEGGTAIYIGTEPGFKEAEVDEPSFPLFRLVDGTALTLEVTAIDPDVSLKLDDVTLSAVGQSTSIGTTPGIHQDLEWQVAVPPGGSASGHSVSVKLTTTSSMYGNSTAYTFALVPTVGPPPEEE